MQRWTAASDVGCCYLDRGRRVSGKVISLVTQRELREAKKEQRMMDAEPPWPAHIEAMLAAAAAEEGAAREKLAAMREVALRVERAAEWAGRYPIMEAPELAPLRALKRAGCTVGYMLGDLRTRIGLYAPHLAKVGLLVQEGEPWRDNQLHVLLLHPAIERAFRRAKRPNWFAEILPLAIEAQLEQQRKLFFADDPYGPALVFALPNQPATQPQEEMR